MGGSVPPIPGELAPPEIAQSLRWEVARLLGRNTPSFPGAQPVSFDAGSLVELHERDYWVCEKSDGIRCLMYCSEEEVLVANGEAREVQEVHYLIDRKNDYYRVTGLHFPIPGDTTFQRYHLNTILDGELVYDTQPDGSKQLKYLVFDCLVLDNDSKLARTLDKRIAYFLEMVYRPYETLLKTFPEEVQYMPFIVERKSKETQLSYGIEKLFREVIPKLQHGHDGLIFTCRTTEYKPGTDPHILKWKPANENSIDFVLSLDFAQLDPDSDDENDGATDSHDYDFDTMPTFNLMITHGNNDYQNYATMHMDPEEWERMKALNEPLDWRIVECVLDDEYRWRFLRFRDDKKDANHISTVNSVRKSIQDKISEEDLIRAAKGIRDAWKRREAKAVPVQMNGHRG
ncbi:MAG: Dcp1p-Dcp2p decapping enzyme complex alpha subunit [Candelina submexicana]|nr:MAG: Dcp1p-Dcp2p decapping enzyme complex alpha subunit [Candelina submexicana]